MDKTLFDQACRAAFGENYTTDISIALGVSDRAVRNWRNGTRPVPESMRAELLALLNERIHAIESVKDIINKE
jgi:uracil-DNA glycosylase